MHQEELRELLTDCVRDIFDAEKQLIKALPKMAKGSQSDDLRQGIEGHLRETEMQVDKLVQVFEKLGVAARGKHCKGMEGLIEEGAEILKEEEAGTKRDLGIIAAAQKVEHYEISSYGTAKALAIQLGEDEMAVILEGIQKEEETTDEKLTEIASKLYRSSSESVAGVSRKPTKQEAGTLRNPKQGRG